MYFIFNRDWKLIYSRTSIILLNLNSNKMVEVNGIQSQVFDFLYRGNDFNVIRKYGEAKKVRKIINKYKIGIFSPDPMDNNIEVYGKICSENFKYNN